MARSPSSRLRCAIYTRKSTDEGLDKDFNSLDAQREACAAYVLSQKHEGWVLHPDLYDDGGFTGGNIDRPGLQQLLDDVKAGRVDVVVVYKVDRLTRSLADFAKIVEVLDDAGASFVSVTQAFNTTNSMGRLTLNVLLSFAQFEREVISERIRDKVAASKARGMWMGGPVPLGYRVEDRKLMVVPEEAVTVREIMRRYLACDRVVDLLADMERDGIITARRMQRDGKVRGGIPFRRGGLASLLANRVYIGEIVHKGVGHPGQHEPIVDRELFDAVQEKLKSQPCPRVQDRKQRVVSVLAGMIFDAEGRPMVPSHTRAHGRRYRYYTTRASEVGDRLASRLPAGEIETAVVKQLSSFLSDSSRVRDLIPQASTHELAALIRRGTVLGCQLIDASPAELQAMLRALDFQVQVDRDGVVASISRAEHLQVTEVEAERDRRIEIAIPCSFETYGHEQRLRLDPPSAGEARPDDQLLDLLARAFEARDQLLVMSSDDVAAMSSSTLRHLRRIARISYLSPAIIKSILDGTHPRELTSRDLWRVGTLPVAWREQKTALGFPAR